MEIVRVKYDNGHQVWLRAVVLLIIVTVIFAASIVYWFIQITGQR